MKTCTQKIELFCSLHDKGELQERINNIIYLVTTNPDYVDMFDNYDRGSLMNTLLQITSIALKGFEEYETKEMLLNISEN